MIRAALRKILAETRRNSSMTERDLRQIQSFVLHDHSESPSVRAAARDCQRHAERWFQTARRAPIINEDPIPSADIWLTATIGCPAAIDQLASRQPIPPTVIRADQPSESQRSAEFFRAPAILTLPDRASTMLVLAAIIRPGERDVAIRWHGPFDWPADERNAIRSLESVIQSATGQWRPPANPWLASAEDLLPEREIRPVATSQLEESRTDTPDR